MTSEPANGVELEHAPTEITLTFSEGPRDSGAVIAQIRFLDPEKPLEIAATRRDVRTESLEIASTSGNTVTFRLPDLGPGLYAVEWSADPVTWELNPAPIIFQVQEKASIGAPVLIGASLVLVVLLATAVLIHRRRRNVTES